MKKDSNIWKKFIYVWIMGVCTIFLSLIIADGVFGLNQPPAKATREFVAFLFFWSGMIVLPLLFYKRIKWRNTFLNLPLYFLLYFPIYDMFGLKLTHSFLERGGFFAFPSYMGAILVAVVFWGIQSIFFGCQHNLLYSAKKTEEKVKGRYQFSVLIVFSFQKKENGKVYKGVVFSI